MAGVVAAVATVAMLVTGGEANEAQVEGDAVGQEVAGGNCNFQGDGNVVTCESSGGTETDNGIDEQVLEDVERFANVDPSGEGSWPFAVVKTGGQGLKVRSTNVVEGEHLGGLAPHHVAWAECQAVSAFDPDPTTGVGPVWLRIRWDQQQPSTEFHNSNSGADATAWAFRGYLAPIGHNGDIPSC